jgi:hypothetical protein
MADSEPEEDGWEEGSRDEEQNSEGDDDVEEVEASGLRCEPWYQGTRAPQSWTLVPGHFLILFFI